MYRQIFQNFVSGTIRDTPKDSSIWDDADWFQLMWDKFITLAVARGKPVGQHVAEDNGLTMYNHAMVYRVICTIEQLMPVSQIQSRALLRGKSTLYILSVILQPNCSQS